MRIRCLMIATTLVGFELSCSGANKGEGDKVADSGKPTDDDDDTEVAQAVPMALLGDDYLARVTTNLSPAETSGTTNDTSATPTADPEADDYRVAKAVLSASARAAGDTKTILDGVQSLLASLFGPTGYFRGRDVELAAGVNERIFRVESGDIRFIAVRINGTGADHKFGVDLYRTPANGQSERVTAIDFSPLAGGGADVRLQHTSPQADGSVQRIDSRYKTDGLSVDTVFGLNTPTSTSPAKTVTRVAYDGATATLDVQGAFVWQRDVGAPATAVPSYYSPGTGDFELFKLRARKTDAGPSAQQLAYVPAADAATASHPLATTVFESFTYADQMRAYLLRIVRTPTLNGSCSTMGATFKSGFSGSVPQAVALLPDDVCAANTALTDAAMTAAIEAFCASAQEIAVPVRSPEGSSTSVNVALCAMRYEQDVLSNPQYFRVADGQRVLIQNMSEVTSEHATLVDELDALGFVDTSPLQSFTWPANPSRAEADFASAATRPD